ncbi:MAG TPA: cyclic nucleotide-binding domain-containing protein, partial [Bryobacteraceae bacterium]|nr:cyclic nucleotide-binding domain-containing protein [Bryobacteraceae bacterium]
LLTLAFGTGLLGYLPVPILGGMLLQLGAVMLDDWLLSGWKRMQATDFAQVCAILVLIIWLGFLAGIAAGIVVACVTFAVSSSRVRLVKLELNRSNFSSRLDRSPAQNAELIRHGDRIRIFRLHGFVFFGSANNLLLHVKEIVGAGRKEGIGVVVLDFLGVLGIDSSAVMSLIKLSQFAEREGILLAASSVPAKVETVMRAGGLFAGGAGSWQLFNDLDAALEWSEEQLLNEITTREEALRSADEWLTREMGGAELFRAFASYLETQEYKAGDTLFRQGDPADSLALVHSGRVSVILHSPDGREVRVRSMVQQTIVGEMGLYRARPRGASVIVDRPTVVYRFTAEALEQLEQDNPQLAYAFHKFVIRTLADRLDFANREVSALQQ